MKTKTIDLYEFDELPENIKAKVLERNRDINTDYEWHDMTLSDWKEKLEELGFNNSDIRFSGFYSQGDGASFTCKSVDVEKFLTAQKKRGKFPSILKLIKGREYDVTFSIERIDHHYSHEYTVTVNSEIYPYDYEGTALENKLEREEPELRGLIRDVARGLMREIYSDLESEFEGLTSDEAIIDTIKANEYTFRANGIMENS